VHTNTHKYTHTHIGLVGVTGSVMLAYVMLYYLLPFTIAHAHTQTHTQVW